MLMWFTAPPREQQCQPARTSPAHRLLWTGTSKIVHMEEPMAPSTYEVEDVLVWTSVVGMALGPVVVQCPKAVECQGVKVGVGGLV